VIAERELLSQAKKLEQQALAEIYDTYSPRLYRYAFRLLGDACIAEDCVAETFSRFLQSVHMGRGPSEFLQGYLFRTAHNFIVDYYRRAPIEQLSEQIQDKANVETDAGRNIRQRRIRSAVRELSPDQQQVIALKFLEGWENEEIAQVLHKPIGAVKSLQHRAINHLQKLLLDDEL
jgi:RNA polymerase sigma-70 factor, ECF subfamily